MMLVLSLWEVDPVVPILVSAAIMVETTFVAHFSDRKKYRGSGMNYRGRRLQEEWIVLGEVMNKEKRPMALVRVVMIGI
jgi:hypothetical protein